MVVRARKTGAFPGLLEELHGEWPGTLGKPESGHCQIPRRPLSEPQPPRPRGTSPLNSQPNTAPQHHRTSLCSSSRPSATTPQPCSCNAPPSPWLAGPPSRPSCAAPSRPPSSAVSPSVCRRQRPAPGQLALQVDLLWCFVGSNAARGLFCRGMSVDRTDANVVHIESATPSKSEEQPVQKLSGTNTRPLTDSQQLSPLLRRCVTPLARLERDTERIECNAGIWGASRHADSVT